MFSPSSYKEGATLDRAVLLNQGETATGVGAKLRRAVGVRTGDELRRGEEAILSSASCCKLASRSHSTMGVNTFGDGANRGDFGGWMTSLRGVASFWGERTLAGVPLDGVATSRSGDNGADGAGGG